LGVSYDAFRSDLLDRNQLNPKLGVTWDLPWGTTLRAAWFRTLKRSAIAGQTIEPTQVAGFNQLFDDPFAAKARRWGIAIDQKLSASIFAGAEWSERRLDVPTFFAGPPPFAQDFTNTERFARGYLGWLPSDTIAFSFEPQWERFVRDPLAQNPGFFAEVNLLRLPVQLRWFDRSGLIGLVRATFVHEQGQFLFADGSISPGKDDFVTVDAGIGWRWPGRAAIATVEARNIFDSGFRFQDTDPVNPRILPGRQVLGRVSFVF
jgi:hypothetical protein